MTRHFLLSTFLCGSAALGQTNDNAASNGVRSTLTGLPPATPLPNGGDHSAGTLLSGRVAMEGGAVPPPGIDIEMVCSNFRQKVASTNSKGQFTFRWGGKENVVSDASGSGQRSSLVVLGVPSGEAISGLRTIVSCDVRAILPGYQSDQVSLTDRRVLDHTDVGVILLHRTFAVDGGAVSTTSLKAPKKARDAYRSALKAQRSGKADMALKEFQRAIAAWPEFADAWLELGRLQQKLGSAQTAREAWKKAIELDPKLSAAYVELGLDAGLSHAWKVATGYLDQGLRLDPVNHPEAWFGDAVAHYYLGEFEASEKSAREAVRLDPEGRNPRAGYVLGMALERKGDREGAAAELRRYLQAAPQAADAETVKAHLAVLETRGHQEISPAK